MDLSLERYRVLITTVNYDIFFHSLLWLETLEQHPGFLPSRIPVSTVSITGGIRKTIAGKVSADLFQPGLFQEVERG